jgi:hypothetical protein
MNSQSLLLMTDSIIIKGQHYKVSNGFLSKENGEKKLNIKDIISADWVKRRSKKAMYAVLLLGSVLLAFVSRFGSWYKDEDLLAIAVGLAVIICTAIVIYLFSVRRFAEITTMRGTYRVAVNRGDEGAVKAIVAQLRSRIG